MPTVTRSAYFWSNYVVYVCASANEICALVQVNYKLAFAQTSAWGFIKWCNFCWNWWLWIIFGVILIKRFHMNKVFGITSVKLWKKENATQKSSKNKLCNMSWHYVTRVFFSVQYWTVWTLAISMNTFFRNIRYQ